VSRPVKCRRICHFPQTVEFSPVGGEKGEGMVVLTVDEYETLRLIDKEGLSQEECCALMQVARTTVQKIYESARKKLAIMLVDGLPLRIDGGEFRLCDGAGEDCRFACFKQQYHSQYEKPKGDNIMRIAVTYENGQIFQHFGHTKQFKVYDIADGKIVSENVVDTGSSGHGALAGVLGALNCDALICGGIGAGAQQALAAAGIRLYGGVSGSADAAVQAFVSGNLAYNPDVMCNHHGDHHHDNCGEHHGNCGEHGCGHH